MLQEARVTLKDNNVIQQTDAEIKQKELKIESANIEIKALNKQIGGILKAEAIEYDKPFKDYIIGEIRKNLMCRKS